MRYVGLKKEIVGIRGQTSFWYAADLDVGSLAGKNENINLHWKPLETPVSETDVTYNAGT